jgi:dienelactone hydrolase
MWTLLFLFAAPPPETLPGTKPLTLKGDLAEQMVAGIDRFLMRELERTHRQRPARWKLDTSSTEAYERSLQPYRARLAHMLGVRDERATPAAPELVATLEQPALVGRGVTYDVFAIRWKAFADVTGEGLLLTPRKGKPIANVIAIPDADITPEQLCGLMPGVTPEAQYARRLVENGCRVFVPLLINREVRPRFWEGKGGVRSGGARMTNREFLYRPAYEMGRQLIGYELQKILALVDWLHRDDPKTRLGVIGWGEGGMLALYTGALDPRIGAIATSGYFGASRTRWQQPLDRSVFGLLNEFSDGDVAGMIAPRFLAVKEIEGPRVELPSTGGAPGKLGPISAEDFRTEWNEAVPLRKAPAFPNHLASDGNLSGFADLLLKHWKIVVEKDAAVAPKHLRPAYDPAPRHARQMAEIDRHTQGLLEQSHHVRRDYLPIADQFVRPDDAKKLDTSSLAAYEKSIEPYRDIFATEVIGRFDRKALPLNARTRKIAETDKVVMYQVVLDVYEDVFAYGLLLLPRDLKADEKRPVVVCQHGLEGRPEHTIGKEGFASYKAFSTQLAERGFIVFAPQNPYIGKDNFRVLQRKANLMGKTLFSIIVPQHQQITDWLKTLPQVEGSRIGFYGLSYGGKTAMRVPALVKNYCLSICSADFNDWVWKNASTKDRYSYVWTMEYEIFEWDLGHTFNYAEMAALIAPRPFMVERGHSDGVGPDERVALEYAKVRHLYQSKLKIGNRTQIEFFVGPHTINGQGTFDFLHKHLGWAKR